jgi:septum formation protein
MSRSTPLSTIALRYNYRMLILASSSPRRAALMRAAGIPCTVEAADVDEAPLADEPPGSYVVRVAREKARAVSCRKPGNPVLGADTTVVVEGLMLGKPADRDEARTMLERLSGRLHDVLTGVVLRYEDREWEAVASTRVRFLPLSAREIEWYIDSGEPDGKAGAYAIQGLASRFIDRVEGSYSNVVGLPVTTVYGLLRSARLL